MTALTYHRAGLRNIVDAAILEIVGRMGTAGITLDLLAGVLRSPTNTLIAACRRLVRAGLLEKPARDTKQGRPNRYIVTPAGLQTLRHLAPLVLPAQQIPMPLIP